jgi:hypothetical protein
MPQPFLYSMAGVERVISYGYNDEVGISPFGLQGWILPFFMTGEAI